MLDCPSALSYQTRPGLTELCCITNHASPSPISSLNCAWYQLASKVYLLKFILIMNEVHSLPPLSLSLPPPSLWALILSRYNFKVMRKTFFHISVGLVCRATSNQTWTFHRFSTNSWLPNSRTTLGIITQPICINNNGTLGKCLDASSCSVTKMVRAGVLKNFRAISLLGRMYKLLTRRS